ncbi:50S ribosomal protein L17 [Fulvivirga sediminis]|uniref:Large ribosomal subunit protein bL17 n=1 Tax=Fulvivirga sediminis TaxID=2803949 RepID=A0A937F5L3_9BACT|nr:50S ribosomal protein L17 [Fulvivirga sediminis]MBL3656796.1 50S ribosomal protein L17 [Fulvivirga sediminis]
MRHGKKFNHLGRTAPHRKAMLSNMAASLIINKRITTTVAKAKALRKYVEPLITRAKADTTHSRRMVFSYLNDKHSVKMLFDEVAEKIADRPGGYTRILKTGNRLGDNADMCIIELVDYNELLLQGDKPAKSKTRRSRRGGKSQTAEASGADATTETKAEEPKAKGDASDETADEKKD